MMMNTHIILANNIYEVIDLKKNYLINKNRFIWGNVKPDCTPKYKVIKHYYNESINMVLDKIDFLASLSISEIYFSYGKKKFSEELGVICHFLCDYFCVPHHQRWEFKNAMKKHVTYENNLAKVAKEYKPLNYVAKELNSENVINFIVNKQLMYNYNIGYINDLEYSYLVCNSIVDMILNENIKNEYYKEKRAV